MTVDTVIRTVICLGSIDQIPEGEGRVFVVEDTEIAVFRSRNGKVFATQARCPHREGPLADGIMGGSILICPLHGWKFNMEDGSGPGCSLTTYTVSLDEEGLMHLHLLDKV